MSFSFRESSGKDESGSMFSLLSRCFSMFALCNFFVCYFDISRLRLYVFFDDAQ